MYANITIFADILIVWAPVLPLISLAVLCSLFGLQCAMSIGQGLGIEHEADASRVSTGYIAFGLFCAWALYVCHAICIGMPPIIAWSLVLMPFFMALIASACWGLRTIHKLWDVETSADPGPSGDSGANEMLTRDDVTGRLETSAVEIPSRGDSGATEMSDKTPLSRGICEGEGGG